MSNKRYINNGYNVERYVIGTEFERTNFKDYQYNKKPFRDLIYIMYVSDIEWHNNKPYILWTSCLSLARKCDNTFENKYERKLFFESMLKKWGLFGKANVYTFVEERRIKDKII